MMAVLTCGEVGLQLRNVVVFLWEKLHCDQYLDLALAKVHRAFITHKVVMQCENIQ